MNIKIIRPFCIAGKRQEKDSEIEVIDSLGRELIGQGKAAKSSVDEVAKPKELKEKKYA